MLHSPLYPSLSTLSQSDLVEKFTSCKNKMSGFDNLSISDKLNMLIAMFRVTNFMSAIIAVVVGYQGGSPAVFITTTSTLGWSAIYKNVTNIINLCSFVGSSPTLH